MLTDERFEALAAKYIDMVYRVAFGALKNREDAEDVTQEVLIKLYREKRDFESMEHVKRWLIRVTVNQSRKLFRSPWRRVEPLEDYAEMLGGGISGQKAESGDGGAFGTAAQHGQHAPCPGEGAAEGDFVGGGLSGRTRGKRALPQGLFAPARLRRRFDGGV